MGWFSSSSDDEPPKTFTDTSSSSAFDSDPGYSASSGGGALGGGGGMADMRQFAASIQQQTLVQGIISDITKEAMEKCITGTPKDGKLSSSQVSCVHSAVNKWMDTNEFMNGRMAAKAQQANQGGMQLH
ncbi:expressed unknown protein [Seminavis robusta]|uniref:Mitochondrial import inner membrane translocase subunit n=1 Tax=Seminavis robusta TaxID=568900 RepID=A0A9N8F265_9STRA|nr:expressed unknown protein [Seminavis robusta]|eukprot:Sro2940_g340690.1 n/a (129) ;mRNA; f:6824-7210